MSQHSFILHFYKFVYQNKYWQLNYWLIGFLIDVGTRDETAETSGSLLALKNTYLKTLKHTNETINYGMI